MGHYRDLAHCTVGAEMTNFIKAFLSREMTARMIVLEQQVQIHWTEGTETIPFMEEQAMMCSMVVLTWAPS